jgi:hypothetical protein
MSPSYRHEQTFATSVQEILRGFAGATTYELAASFNLHRESVTQALDAAGEPRRDRRLHVDLERAAELERSG